MFAHDAKTALLNGSYDAKLAYIYACSDEQALAYRQRLLRAIDRFEEMYGSGRDIFVFSAPGRTEIGGNHTDHQRGCVLAASVNLDVIAVGSLREDSVIRVHSEGYPEDVVDISDPLVHPEESHTSKAIIRGIAASFTEMGYGVGGFDAYTTSDVLSGSGLSSSAAFEVLIGTLISQTFCSDRESPLKIAQIGQLVENRYFGKPCGLMDQAASSIGGFVSIDFCDLAHPTVEKIAFDFAKSGYALCIVDTHGSHADLTPDYAAVPAEMKQVAAFFGKEVLREVAEEEFYQAIPQLREAVSDRAILRAIHFFADNARAPLEAQALKAGDFDTFKNLVIESGRSSYCYLQNVYSPTHPQEQGVSLGLALCERLLAGTGAWRVHGGGFAGTVQAFVPNGMVPRFQETINGVFGPGSCHILNIRPVGGIQLL